MSFTVSITEKDNSYEGKQERLKKDLDNVEKFKEKYPKNIETFFKDRNHVADISMLLKCNIGNINTDWFLQLPLSMSNTGDIIKHNEEAENDADKIRQYMYIGLKDNTPDALLEELQYEIDMLKLKYMSGI